MLLEKIGIELEVWFEREKILPDGNGYLGEFGKGNFYLEYTLPEKEPRPICFIVDGKKNIIPFNKNVKVIPVTMVDGGTFTTKYDSNNVRFAVIEQTGKCKVWEIAIVSQDSVFFLTEQMVYERHWFREENGEAVCPDFENWPQIVEFLRPIMEQEELPSISEYQPPPETKTNGLLKSQGKVVWWNLALQLGLISLDGKGTVARVHWKSLPPDMHGGLRKLEPGQVVSFQELREIPSTARTITVSLEAKKITLL